MKILSLILLTLMMSKSCSKETQNDIANSVIEYAAHTRGYHLTIMISNQKATISEGRGPENRPKVVAISNDDWNELVAEFQTLNLEEISTLKDPTQKRFYDGAAIATLKVKYQDKNYDTTEFDHGFPPPAIEKFVNKVVSLARVKE